MCVCVCVQIYLYTSKLKSVFYGYRGIHNNARDLSPVIPVAVIDTGSVLYNPL